jgi:hypothetical protein
MGILMYCSGIYPLFMTNIAMENGPFIDGLPIKNGGSFHGYVSHKKRVDVSTQAESKSSSPCAGGVDIHPTAQMAENIQQVSPRVQLTPLHILSVMAKQQARHKMVSS